MPRGSTETGGADRFEYVRGWDRAEDSRRELPDVGSEPRFAEGVHVLLRDGYYVGLHFGDAGGILLIDVLGGTFRERHEIRTPSGLRRLGTALASGESRPRPNGAAATTRSRNGGRGPSPTGARTGSEDASGRLGNQPPVARRYRQVDARVWAAVLVRRPDESAVEYKERIRLAWEARRITEE